MSDFHPQGGSGRTASGSHEEKDLSLRAVLSFGLGLAVIVATVFLALSALFGRYARGEARRDVPHPPLRADRLVPPQPRLETGSGEDVESLRQAEDERLSTYGWIDRKKGVVRIPIDQAIEILARRGLRARAQRKSAE